jgi:two-component system phosphate regulon sensor histidine kinase PhoR
VSFRAKIFLTALTAAAMAVLVSTGLVTWSMRRDLQRTIEQSLTLQARMAAEILSHRASASDAELDAEADALGRIVGARVTFIAADGRVVGDSALSVDQLRTTDNHALRPEVLEARARGAGAAQRRSAATGTDMAYVAIPVQGPAMSRVAIVRLALPLTDVERQLASVRSLAAFGFVAGTLAALVLTAIFSFPLTRRLRAIEDRARRYAAGSIARTVPDYEEDEIGSVSRMLDSLTEDLTTRLAGLEADRARMAAILSGMVEGVIVVNEHGRLQLVNEAARRLLRLDDALEGRHYPEIVRHPAVSGQIAAALAGQPPGSVELTGVHDTSQTLIARVAGVRVASGRAAVVVFHDITDLRRTDQIRRDFVANVSHELRTPLTAIKGYVEALADATPEEARGFLEVIARHTLRMERLIRDLLRLARIEAGQEMLDRSACSVEALIAAVQSDLAGLLASKHLTVDVTVAPDAKAVTGDPTKLQDVLRNLIENAANYSPEGGRIAVEAAAARGRVRIRVQDQGPGIPPGDLTRVFERFYRVDKSRTRDGRDPAGTGLGLSIVRHLIGLHGGTVTAANAEPHGAIFTIDLPI